MAESTTVNDIAAHFGVHHRTIRRWLKTTSIPHRRIGGSLRFDLEEVLAWSREEPAPQADGDSSEIGS